MTRDAGQARGSDAQRTPSATQGGTRMSVMGRDSAAQVEGVLNDAPR